VQLSRLRWDGRRLDAPILASANNSSCFVDNEFDSHDAAVFLQWAGYALIVIYAITVITEVMPLALLQPTWLILFSGKILGGAAFALTGAVLLVIALRFDPQVLPLSRFQKRLRQSARLVALGFLLLIPLQTIAGVVGLNNDARDVQRRLVQLEQATEVISKANDEQSLIEGLSLLPGAPKFNGQKLSVPVPLVKKQVLAQLNRQIPLLQTRVQQVKKLRLENGLVLWLRQGVVSAAYAIAFWMLGTRRVPFRVTDDGDESRPFSPEPIPVFSPGRLRRSRRGDHMAIPPEWLEGPESVDQSGP